MFEFFSRLFDSDFMPHGQCFMWNPAVLWIHVVSDVLIALAYFSIPLALVTFIRQRRDLAYPWVFALFAVFIVSCGLTHLIDVVTTWNGAYRIEGVAKAITALSSITTAILIWPLIPKLIALPSPTQLEAVNADLRVKIESLQLAEQVAGVGHFRVDVRHDSIEWSPEVYRIHGREPGRPPTLDEALAAYHPDDRAEVETRLQRAIEHGEPFEFELRLLRSDGEIRYVRSVARAETDPRTDRVVAVLGVFQDVTAEHQRRQQLERQVAERTELLRRANEDLESFAYAASHDLKEPLRMISSYITLIERRLGEHLDAKGRRYVQHTVLGASRMATLIDDLLAFSRASQAELEFESLDLHALVDRIAADVTTADGAPLRVEVEPLPTVVAVRTVVRQVLHNLLSNAGKYAGEHPRVKVSARRDPDDEGWIVRVADQGEGIPADQRDRIFEPLVRLHGRDHSEGTGIGLAICRRLVERSGGRLWVEDETPQGAAFLFTIPDHPLPAADEAGPSRGR